jgi:hypothetical protein
VPTTPDPEEEPAKDGLSDEDAIWRSIIENYGERPTIEEQEIEVPPSLRDLEPRPEPGAPEQSEEPAELDDRDRDPDDHFVPPAPPPIPRPETPRLLAWIGLFGVPVLVLVALVARIPLPSWLGLFLMAWFVGGFVYLVASMRPRPEDYDDGARL